MRQMTVYGFFSVVGDADCGGATAVTCPATTVVTPLTCSAIWPKRPEGSAMMEKRERAAAAAAKGTFPAASASELSSHTAFSEAP